MNRFLRGAALGALTLAAATALASAASAQSYGRLVVFGDSLSDNGNLYAASFNTQPTSPPYFQGRFSNGPVFTELLGFNAARGAVPGSSLTGSINYAYGGARTDPSVLNLFVVPPTIPGMRTQLSTYVGAGGTFGANDLVSVLGGANNIFQGLAAAGATSNPAGAIATVSNAAVADINFLVGDIATRGAGTILVTNLPRLGITPQFRGTTAAPLVDFAGSTFNTSLANAMLALAPTRPNTNIILFDLAKVSDVLASDPGRFGLSNVTAACFNGATVCSNPDSYLYWDGVHPTAAGHRLIATLSNDYLYYGDRASNATLQGEMAFRHREDALDQATARLSGREAWTAGTSIHGGAFYDAAEFDARGAASEGESTSHGAHLGLESGTESLRFGLSGAWRVADVEAGPTDFELQTLSLDLYGGWRSGNVFVNGAVGVASEDFNDITRISALSPLVQTATTRGFSSGARAQAGLWLEAGGIAVSPRVAVTWASSEIDGYTEQGFAASYQYQDREVKGVTAEASVRAEGDMGGFGFFVEGGYRDSLDDSSEAVRVGIAGNPAQVLSRPFDDPFGGSILASAGLTGDVGPFDLEVGYRGRFGDHADSHTGGITLTLPLS